MEDGDWTRLIRQLQSGECTPLLGAGACAHRLPTGGMLSRHFAEEYNYPFTDTDNLPRVAQFAATTHLGDPIEVKRDICRHLEHYLAEAPPPADVLDPHVELARFPIKTFLTTNYDNLMAEALRGVARDPQVAASRLVLGRSYASEVVDPTPGRPLVYHLHGNWDNPDEIVLTDDDFIDYQHGMVSAAASGEPMPLPEQVVDAITGSPLLMIGYSLQDWAFRVLYSSLLSKLRRTRRSISVQLVTTLNGNADAEERATKYLKQYLDGWNISIFIGSGERFFHELRTRMGAS